MRREGRVESRQRFKYKSGQPLGESRTPDYLFLDESGRSDLRFPGAYFVIGGVAMAETDISAYQERADALKMDFFGQSDMTFHEPQMRNHEGWFGLGGREERQRELCEALDELVAKSSCTVFGVAVRKDILREFVGSREDPYLPPDPYSVAIQMLLERYVDYLATRGDDPFGQVTFESIGPREDAEHHRDYVDLLLQGTQWVPESAFRNWLGTGCAFMAKESNHPMELADMFSRDLFEWVRGGCGEVVPRRWDAWEPKIYARGDAQMGKFGIKVFPDSDIRDRIEEHRQKVISKRN